MIEYINVILAFAVDININLTYCKCAKFTENCLLGAAFTDLRRFRTIFYIFYFIILLLFGYSQCHKLLGYFLWNTLIFALTVNITNLPRITSHVNASSYSVYKYIKKYLL